MMEIAAWITLLGLAVPAYTYFGYPILLFLLASVVQVGRDVGFLLFRSNRRGRSDALPTVSLIIAAHNEEAVIQRTLDSCRALDYPRDRLEVLVGSDHSTDRTVEIAGNHDGVRVLAFRERRGKLAVISDCAANARGDILIFSDANTLLEPDAVTRLARHFDRAHIGAVCGELRLTTPGGAVRDEGLYWRFEVTLKFLESRIDSVLGANGAIYAVRKHLFPTLPHGLITDDFVIPMKVRSRGFRVLYDPEAVALEEAPAGMSDEFGRRVRIGAGNWQALWHCRALLLPWKGFAAFAFWSHKVARWFTPFCLVAALAANTLLLSTRLGLAVFCLQAAFYALAAGGGALEHLRLPAGPLRLIHYFIVINAAIALGMVRGALGLQKVTWRRTAREPAHTGGES